MTSHTNALCVCRLWHSQPSRDLEHATIIESATSRAPSVRFKGESTARLSQPVGSSRRPATNPMAAAVPVHAEAAPQVSACAMPQGPSDRRARGDEEEEGFSQVRADQGADGILATDRGARASTDAGASHRDQQVLWTGAQEAQEANAALQGCFERAQPDPLDPQMDRLIRLQDRLKGGVLT